MKYVVWLLLAAALVLTACSGDSVYEAYTASGDGTTADKLNKTTAFRYDDDLNVVLTLGAHSRTLPIYAEFEAPTGQIFTTDMLEADRTVGKVVLGLDWEARNTAWPDGKWAVDVFVNLERVHTLEFTVQPPLLNGNGDG